MNPAAAIALGLIVAAMWAIVCRIKTMHPRHTRGLVFLQHAALGMGLVCGLVLPADWARAALAGGIFMFLLGSSGRWRAGAPPGVHKNNEPRRNA